MKQRKKSRRFFRKLWVPKYRSILTRSIKKSKKHIVYLVLTRVSVTGGDTAVFQELLDYLKLHFSSTQLNEIKLFPSFLNMFDRRSKRILEDRMKKNDPTLQDLVKCASGVNDQIILKGSFMICVPRKRK